MKHFKNQEVRYKEPYQWKEKPRIQSSLQEISLHFIVRRYGKKCANNIEGFNNNISAVSIVPAQSKLLISRFLKLRIMHFSSTNKSLQLQYFSPSNYIPCIPTLYFACYSRKTSKQRLETSLAVRNTDCLFPLWPLPTRYEISLHEKRASIIQSLLKVQFFLLNQAIERSFMCSENNQQNKTLQVFGEGIFVPRTLRNLRYHRDSTFLGMKSYRN